MHVHLSRYTLYICVLQTLKHYINISLFPAYFKRSSSSTSPKVSFFCFGLCGLSTVLLHSLRSLTAVRGQMNSAGVGGSISPNYIPGHSENASPPWDHSVCEEVCVRKSRADKRLGEPPVRGHLLADLWSPPPNSYPSCVSCFYIEPMFRSVFHGLMVLPDQLCICPRALGSN